MVAIVVVDRVRHQGLRTIVVSDRGRHRESQTVVVGDRGRASRFWSEIPNLKIHGSGRDRRSASSRTMDAIVVGDREIEDRMVVKNCGRGRRARSSN